MQVESFVAWWWRVLRLRWLTGGLLFTVVLGLGIAMLFLSRPVYRAESKLRLGEPPPMGGVSPTSGFVGLFRLGGDPFANDLELLSSRTLAEGVVDDVALNVKLIAPRGWHRDSLVTAIAASRATRRATYEVEWLDRDSLVVRRVDRRGNVVRAAPGVAVTFGGVRVVFREWRRGMPREIRLKTIPHAEAARLTGGRIAVQQTRRDANVVRLRNQDPDPGMAQAIIASAVDRFIALRTSIQRRESGETVDSLRVIAEHTRSELERAEAALEGLQRTSALVAPDAQAQAAINQFTETGTRLELTRMELAALDGALARTGDDAEPTERWSALLAYPRFFGSGTLANLVQQLTALEQKRRELARVRTPDNIELRAVREQIDYLDGSLRSLARDHRATLVGQVGALERQVGQIAGGLARMPSQAIALARQQRDTKVLAEIVVVTEQRLRQEQLREALTFANVQVIDPPALRDRQVWPRKKLGLLVTMMLAGFTALLGMIVVERADTTVRRASELRAELNAPVLGVVHRYRSPPFTLTGAEISALVRRGIIDEPGRSRIALASVDEASITHLVADAIMAGAAREAGGDGVRLACPKLTLLEPIDCFAAASAAAATRLPIVLVARTGQTGRTALSRAATLLTEAGVSAVGAILVCDRARDARDVWL